MKNNKLNAQGFTHYVLVLAVVVILVIIAIFTLVLRTNHDKKTSSQATVTSSRQSKSTASSPAQSQAAGTTASPSSGASATSKAAGTTTTPNSQSAGGNGTAPNTKAIDVLTAIIGSLKAGSGDASVTSGTVDVPGPITTAHARPIVFTANGQTYFAYTQGQPPKFSGSAAETANTMAIVVATATSPSVMPAHLDKAGNLVDANIVAVGYSTGGN